MPDPKANPLSERLRKLPGQLLLALVNATAVLVIAAAVLVLVAAARVEHLANNVASTMTDAVLSRFDLEPQRFMTELRGVVDNVNGLAVMLNPATTQGAARLRPEIIQLEQQLAALQTNLRRLGESKTQLIDETITAFARSVAENLDGLKRCGPGETPSVTDPALGTSGRHDAPRSPWRQRADGRHDAPPVRLAAACRSEEMENENREKSSRWAARPHRAM